VSAPARFCAALLFNRFPFSFLPVAALMQCDEDAHCSGLREVLPCAALPSMCFCNTLAGAALRRPSLDVFL
jgi:hypothetical protein